MSGKDLRFIINIISIIFFIFLISIEIIVIMRAHLTQILEIGLYITRDHLYIHPRLPIRFLDLSYWLAITTINLLAISVFINPKYVRIKLYIRNERFRRISILLEGLFLFTAAIRIYRIVITL